MGRYGKPKQFYALIGIYDLQGFVQLVDNKPPRELFEILQSIHSIANRRIRSEKGHVIKHVGDGSLFLFPEESIEHAPRSAPILKKEIEQFLEARGIKNRISICMASGEVVVGKLTPFKTIDVIGRPVNEAFSLLRHANGDRLIITKDVFQRIPVETQKRFRYQEAQQIYVHG
jgi:class 3 adenylate cyclase